MKAGASSPPSSPTASHEHFGEALTYDPEFRGPVKERSGANLISYLLLVFLSLSNKPGWSCTDVICLFVFAAFIAGWVVIAIFAFMEGKPEALVYPTDTEGNICGLGPMQNKTFLFFFDLTKCARPNVVFTGCPTPQVCVESCPNETFSTYFNPDAQSLKDKLICKYAVDRNTKTVEQLVSDNDCAGIYFKSVPLMVPKVFDDVPYAGKIKDPFVRRCIPEALFFNQGGEILDSKNHTVKTADDKILTRDIVQKATRFLAKFLNAKEVGQKMFMDVKSSWYLILTGLIFSMLLSLIWILLMRWLAGIMVWTSIVLVVCFSAYACYYSSVMYKEIRDHSESETATQKTFSSNLSSFFALKYTWLGFAIVSGLILAILLLVLIFLRKRLVIAIALIKQASKAVGYIMSSLLFPLVPYLIQIGIFAYWASVSVYLASSGKAQFRVHNAPNGSQAENGTKCVPGEWVNKTGQCLFRAYGSGNNFVEAQLYNLFGFFWALFFVAGIAQVSLAGAFSAYYWALEKPRDIPAFAMSLGLWRAIRYHMGSVAFGALLLAFVRTIRVMLEYLDMKLKQYDNRVAKGILWCLRCCFWCLEKFMKFINKNAYIMIAIYGKNFCVSAKNAFKLLMRNILRVVVLDKVTDFLLLFGKLVVVGATAALSFYFFSGHSTYFGKYIPELNYNLLPVIIIVLGSYLIASTFFSVYGMAVDTLFLCFLEDCERNDGTPERPYYMSKDLMKILDKKNYRDHPMHTHHS